MKTERMIVGLGLVTLGGDVGLHETAADLARHFDQPLRQGTEVPAKKVGGGVTVSATKKNERTMVFDVERDGERASVTILI